MLWILGEVDGQTWQSVRTMFFWLPLRQQTSFNHIIRSHSDPFTFKSFVYTLLNHRIPHLVEIINERNRCHPHSLPKINQPCLGLRLISNPLTGTKPPFSAHAKQRFNRALYSVWAKPTTYYCASSNPWADGLWTPFTDTGVRLTKLPLVNYARNLPATSRKYK